MKKKYNYDAIVIGAGHAGCEASLALARMNKSTLLITLDYNAIAFLACNPSIGGTAKGQLVSEIDALGGQMGINADATLIQIRMLNESKGPAVQSLRAQVDKNLYHRTMQETLLKADNLRVIEDEAVEILAEDGVFKSVVTAKGDRYNAKAVVICTGVYLNSRTITGEEIKDSGPAGFKNAKGLTESLIKLGFNIKRFKTGTPPRLLKSTIDYSQFEEQLGQDNIRTFSYLSTEPPKNIASCWLGYTNLKTHQIILDNLDRAPMYSGTITGVGPRYCPSIETKIVRFKDKDRHQLFLEPETLENNEIYLQGMSTSMPADIQKQMVESVAGLENASIVKMGYAIEYDAIDSTDLFPTLEFKKVKGIFTAGQINGTSGYEEAGAQGIIAGINAGLYIERRPQLILPRDSSYIGVLIDDLVTKGTNEPYRMMTSRAEYRLLLRQDNADLRLTKYSLGTGIISKERLARLEMKESEMKDAEHILKSVLKPTDELNEFLKEVGENEITTGIAVETLIKRPHINAQKLNERFKLFEHFSDEAIHTINIEAKYSGYIEKEKRAVERNQRLEHLTISPDFDYSKIKGLRIEAVQKLQDVRPLTVGQASRISGVSPADISVLLFNLNR